jgi:hypothetical protein
MDALKAKPLKGEADSGCARVARLVLVWATGAGVYPGVGWAADTLSQGRATTAQALELEPVVVTAIVAPTPLGRTTAPVTVIFREQIAAQQATSAATRPRCAPPYHRGWHSTGFINSYRGQDARRLRSG